MQIIRRSVLLYVLAAGLCQPLAFAATVDLGIPYLECEISLSKEKIIAGEPVDICFAFTNTSEGLVRATLWDSYNAFADDPAERLADESLKISVQDAGGNKIARRKLLCRPGSQMQLGLGLWRIKKGETIYLLYPLHLRIATNLVPGTYRIELTEFRIYRGYLSPEEAKKRPGRWEGKQETFSGPSLTLEVEPYDEAALAAVYDSLNKQGKEAQARISSWHGEDYDDIAHPVRTILWAEGPIAVPYQIDLLYDQTWGFKFWPPALVNTWGNLAQYANEDQITRILKEIVLDKDPSKLSWGMYSSRYDPGMVWAIHQWHAKGSEKVKELTRELVEKFPEEDPCPSVMEFGSPPYGM